MQASVARFWWRAQPVGSGHQTPPFPVERGDYKCAPSQSSGTATAYVKHAGASIKNHTEETGRSRRPSQGPMTAVAYGPLGMNRAWRPR